MVELKGDVIGEINVEYKDKSAFIYGFGILPISEVSAMGKHLLVVIFLYV